MLMEFRSVRATTPRNYIGEDNIGVWQSFWESWACSTVRHVGSLLANSIEGEKNSGLFCGMCVSIQWPVSELYFYTRHVFFPCRYHSFLKAGPNKCIFTGGT